MISSNIDNNNNNFTIKDNSSDIASFLPKYLIEPLTMLARIRNTGELTIM